MRGMLPGQLDDVLTQVSLENTQSGGLEMIIQSDLLGDHRLALGDAAASAGANDRKNLVPGSGSILAIMDLAAPGSEVLLEDLESLRQVLYGAIFSIMSPLAKLLVGEMMREDSDRDESASTWSAARSQRPRSAGMPSPRRAPWSLSPSPLGAAVITAVRASHESVGDATFGTASGGSSSREGQVLAW